MKSNPIFFDIGVNLKSGQFKNDLDTVLENAVEAGVHEMVAIASDVEESLALARTPEFQTAKVWTTAGVHPHQATTFNDTTVKTLRECFADSKCVAIGECGLDYNRMYSPKADQERAFMAQIELALELQAPLYLHQRDAHVDFLRILSTFYARQPFLAVVHCFTEDVDILQEYLALDFYIGVTGWICDERRGSALRRAVEKIPRDRLLLETDAPYLKPRDYQGPIKSRRNEPCLLPHIADFLADILGTDCHQLAAQTRANAHALFGCGRR